MWRQHGIASVYRNILFEVQSFLQKTLTEELLEPKINTIFHDYHVAPLLSLFLSVLHHC